MVKAIVWFQGLWLKVPEPLREAFKEMLRWGVATGYAIVWDLVQEGSFDLSDPKLLVKVILLRFGDRILYLLSKVSDDKKLKSVLRRLLLVA